MPLHARWLDHLNLCSQHSQPQPLGTRDWNGRKMNLRHDVRVAYSTETNTLEGGQGEYMGMTAFDPDSSTNGMLDTRWEAPRNQARAPEDMAQAIADLLRHKSLISTFGDQGEWEVRTTLFANRQAWHYHSSVFLHGKERKKGFPPID